jgi:hypothetical protein
MQFLKIVVAALARWVDAAGFANALSAVVVARLVQNCRIWSGVLPAGAIALYASGYAFSPGRILVSAWDWLAPRSNKTATVAPPNLSAAFAGFDKLAGSRSISLLPFGIHDRTVAPFTISCARQSIPERSGATRH